MHIDECINPDERYIYEERLAVFGATDREPTEQERLMQMQDVKEYRRRAGELVAELG